MTQARLLLIGASSGIGAETYRQIKQEWGTSDNIIDRPTKEEMDVAIPTSVDSYIKEHGPYSHVVYSAGINYLQWIGMALAVEEYELMAVNLMGFINVMDTLKFYDNPPANVVVVGSDAAERPMRTSMAYCASKAGLHMAARVAARELGPAGWHINVVAPGMTDKTGMQEYVDSRVQEVRGWSTEEMMEYEAKQAVVPGRVSTYEVASVILSLLYPDTHVNGSIYTINGGR